MAIKNITITQGFIIAGLMNLTVLIFSRFFTNPTIPEFDSVVMSNFGLLMIVLWGLAYISISKSYREVKWLVGVFVVGKFIYGYVWINWILNNNISAVYKKDTMAGIFYSLYGINDWIFFVFFLLVFIKIFKMPSSLSNA
ncbi:MAG TPA: hypothetical protein VIH09_03845 [Flavobacterium sp.]|uniref:hypothetical protein n=1 Tax=Flavobacterium sp. TaxID=239 RepID=UPI002F3E4EA5